MSNQVKSTPQIVMAGDSPRTRRRDPLTSHRAADLANLPDSQRDVLKKLRVYKMLAAFELESLLPHRSPSRIRTALNELEERGYVQRVDRFRVTPYGRQAHVWGLA